MRKEKKERKKKNKKKSGSGRLTEAEKPDDDKCTDNGLEPGNFFYSAACQPIYVLLPGACVTCVAYVACVADKLWVTRDFFFGFWKGECCVAPLRGCWNGSVLGVGDGVGGAL